MEGVMVMPDKQEQGCYWQYINNNIRIYEAAGPQERTRQFFLVPSTETAWIPVKGLCPSLHKYTVPDDSPYTV